MTHTIDRKPEQGDAPFNMAMMFYIELDRLKKIKNDAFNDGNMIGYTTALQTIYNEVYFKISSTGGKEKSKEEFEAIAKGLETAEAMLSAPVPPDRGLMVQVQNMTFWKVRKILQEVDRKLSVLMDKHKMIFPRIETKFGLSKVYDRYNMEAKK